MRKGRNVVFEVTRLNNALKLRFVLRPTKQDVVAQSGILNPRRLGYICDRSTDDDLPSGSAHLPNEGLKYGTLRILHELFERVLH